MNNTTDIDSNNGDLMVLDLPTNCEFISSFNFSEYEFPNPDIINAPFLWTDYLKIITCIVVIIVTLIGNTSVIIAVLLNRSLRNTINYYLSNLAVADILICVFCLWVHLINNLTEPLYVLGPIMCKINGFAQMTCLTSSVLTLSAISCDRFVAIFFPLRARVTKQRTGSVITIIWIISLIISIPFLMYRKLHEIQWKDLTETSCMESWPLVTEYSLTNQRCVVTYPFKKMYYSMVTVTLFFVPVFVMVTAYSLLVWRLWVHKTPGEIITNTQRAQDCSKKKVVKMVCLVLLCFVICWMPLQIIVLYSLFGHSANDSGELPVWFSTLSYMSTFIAYSNSALNPVIYGGFNYTFRQTLYCLLRCECRMIHRYRVNQTTVTCIEQNIRSSLCQSKRHFNNRSKAVKTSSC